MTPLKKHWANKHSMVGEDSPLRTSTDVPMYHAADVEAVLKECQDHDAALRQQLATLTAERDEAVKIAVGMITWAPITDADVKWAKERLEGLP